LPTDLRYSERGSADAEQRSGNHKSVPDQPHRKSLPDKPVG
jgi:hypothetical protein